MSLILNIDTALETASVCLAKEETILQFAMNENQKDHAAWLHTAIAGLLKKNNYSANALNAVAVSIGPGSYTGLRIGLSAAKGLCYALNIPLITIGTLKMMAAAVQNEATGHICPLIDARRMEVFTATYDKTLRELVAPHSLIAEPINFESALSGNKVLFCGNGSKKLQINLTHINASFSSTISDARNLASLSFKSFLKKDFASLAYTEPLYIKEFFTSQHKPLI